MAMKAQDLSSTCNENTNIATINTLSQFVESTAIEKCMNNEERDTLWNSTLEVYFDTMKDLAKITQNKEEKAKLLEQINLVGDPRLALNDQPTDVTKLNDTICELSILRKSSHAFIAQLQNAAAAKRLELIRLTSERMKSADKTGVSTSDDRATTSSSPVIETINVTFPSMDELRKLKSALDSIKAQDSNPMNKVLFTEQKSPSLPQRQVSPRKAKRNQDDDNSDKLPCPALHKSSIPVPVKQIKEDYNTSLSSAPIRSSPRLRNPGKKTPLKRTPVRVKHLESANKKTASPYTLRQ